jgi:hypothetical protein
VFDGFGVALAVQPVGGAWPAEAAPPGGFPAERPARLGEVLPVAERTAAEKALELGRVQQLRAMLAAYEAELVLGLAAERPEGLDPAPGRPGAGVNAKSPIPGTSEFFVEELAMVTDLPLRAAGRLAEESYVLAGRLPAVWAGLADAELDHGRARVFIDVLGCVRAEVADAAVAAVLPRAAALSRGKLRAALERAVLAVDAAFAEQRRADAEKRADVRMYPTDAGMSALVTELPTPVSAACWATVNELAWMRNRDGDDRPIGQLRSLTMADLILRPWDTSRPPVTAVLDVIAPLPSLRPPGPESGAQTPAEVNGQPITAAHVRELLTHLDAVCPGGLQAPAGGSLQISLTDTAGVLLATASRPQLEHLARTGCPDHPRVGCQCPVLQAPAAVDRYTPSPAQQRFTRAHDRTCRHPGCGRPAARTDLDHCTAYAAGGATDCTNLCCLCRRHHRLKTFATGWRFVLTEHGVLRVTTPSGITRSTRPPGLHDPTELPALPAPPGPPGQWAARVPSPQAEPPPF